MNTDSNTSLSMAGKTFDIYAYRRGLNEQEMELYLEEYPEMAYSVVRFCPEYRVLALRVKGEALNKIPKSEQSLEQVETALQENGYALRYASKAILKENPWLYKTAVRNTHTALSFVPEKYRDEEIYKLAIRDNGCVLGSVPKEHYYKGIFKDAVQSNGLALKYVPKREYYDGIYFDAVSSNYEALELVPVEQRSRELCECALQSSMSAIRFIPVELFDEALAIQAVSVDGELLECIPSDWKTEKVCRAAVENAPSAIDLVPKEFKTVDLKKLAVRLDWQLLDHSIKPNKQLCLVAFEQSPLAIKYFPTNLKTKNRCQNAFERDVRSVVHFPSKFIDADMTERYLEYLASFDWLSSVELDRTVEFLEQIDKDVLRINSIRRYLHELNLMRTKHAFWSKEDSCFYVNDIIKNWKPSRWTDCFDLYRPMFELLSEAQNLDELIQLLDGDLSLVDFGDYAFSDFDKYEHDLSTAHVSSETLKRLGAYDDESFCTLVYADPDVLSLRSSEIGELIPASTHTELLVPYDVKGSEFCYYVSDLHLNHKLANRFPNAASSLEIHDFINQFVQQLVGDVSDEERNTATLIVLGDTSFNFEVASIFYSSLRRSWQGQIVVVLGNHELWNYTRKGKSCRPTPTIDFVVQHYREMLGKLNIVLLHNELLIRYRGYKTTFLNQTFLQEKSDEELAPILNRTSQIILGGIGFTGCCDDFNASSGIYRDVVVSVDFDRSLSKETEELHERIRRLAPEAKVIVATHMPLRSWSTADYQPGWVYLSGHTHCNSFLEESSIRAYEDNQIGYEGTRAALRRFDIETSYDPFGKLDDGIHEVKRLDYLDFNRHRCINIDSFTRSGKILMLKRDGIYMFLFIWDVTEKFYLLVGGRLNKLDVQDPNYYFNNLNAYSKLVKETFAGYQSAIKRVSGEVKLIGGEGLIHGCIVDIDFYNHVYLDPFSGNLTFYYAESISNRVEYSSIRNLIRRRCPHLLNGLVNLPKESDGDSIDSILLMGSDPSITMEKKVADTLMYKPSSVMRSIQYLYDSSVIRVWNEEALGIQRTNRTKRVPSASLPSSKPGKSLPATRIGKRGRPSSQASVARWRQIHPNGSMRSCANELGITIQTVKKWW